MCLILVDSCCRVFCCDPIWYAEYVNRAVYMFCNMWSFTVSSSVQLDSSFNWTVTKCDDTPCCIVLLANTSFYGSRVLMSKWLSCWRVINLSQFVTSWSICKESIWKLWPCDWLFGAGIECFLLLTLLVKELHGCHWEIVCTCYLWGYLHTIVSTNHIEFLLSFFNVFL